MAGIVMVPAAVLGATSMAVCSANERWRVRNAPEIAGLPAMLSMSVLVDTVNKVGEHLCSRNNRIRIRFNANHCCAARWSHESMFRRRSSKIVSQQYR
jgi:hypothetical protein